MLKKTCALALLTCCQLFGQNTADYPVGLNQNDSNIHLVQLSDLITSAEHNLDQLKVLRAQLAKYQEIQIAYLKNESNVELLYKMIALAHSTLKIIQDNHLNQIFDTEFLDELHLFAKMAKK